jgi:hypothetical protein
MLSLSGMMYNETSTGRRKLTVSRTTSRTGTTRVRIFACWLIQIVFSGFIALEGSVKENKNDGMIKKITKNNNVAKFPNS